MLWELLEFSEMGSKRIFYLSYLPLFGQHLLSEYVCVLSFYFALDAASEDLLPILMNLFEVGRRNCMCLKWELVACLQ